jgi:hypothetical protein
LVHGKHATLWDCAGESLCVICKEQIVVRMLIVDVRNTVEDIYKKGKCKGMRQLNQRLLNMLMQLLSRTPESFENLRRPCVFVMALEPSVTRQ